MQLVNILLAEYTLPSQKNTNKMVLVSPHSYSPVLYVEASSSQQDPEASP